MNRFAELLDDPDRKVNQKDVDILLPLISKVDELLDQASNKLIANVLEDPSGSRMRVLLLAAARIEEVIKELKTYKPVEDTNHKLFLFLTQHGCLSPVQAEDAICLLDIYPFFYSQDNLQVCEFETKEAYFRIFRRGDSFEIRKDGENITEDPCPWVKIVQDHWNVAFELFIET